MKKKNGLYDEMLIPVLTGKIKDWFNKPLKKVGKLYEITFITIEPLSISQVHDDIEPRDYYKYQRFDPFNPRADRLGYVHYDSKETYERVSSRKNRKVRSIDETMEAPYPDSYTK